MPLLPVFTAPVTRMYWPDSTCAKDVPAANVRPVELKVAVPVAAPLVPTTFDGAVHSAAADERVVLAVRELGRDVAAGIGVDEDEVGHAARVAQLLGLLGLEAVFQPFAVGAQGVVIARARNDAEGGFGLESNGFAV
jgi:hypothetical protein